MARGPKNHLKRVAAPKHWMLDKLTGVFAPRPSTGPHKLRECLPLIIFLRNRLKYALTGDEVKKICMQRFIKIDGKIQPGPPLHQGSFQCAPVDSTLQYPLPHCQEDPNFSLQCSIFPLIFALLAGRANLLIQVPGAEPSASNHHWEWESPT